MIPRCACGGEFFACRPGTAPDATIYPKPPIADVPDQPVEVQAMVVWCRDCWQRAHRKEAA
jgi:hypothetical protein